MPKIILTRFYFIIYCFILAGFLSGCSQGHDNNHSNSDTGSVAFKLLWPDDAPTQQTSKALDNPGIDCTGISSIEIDIYDDLANESIAGDVFACERGEGTITGIPVGSDDGRLIRVTVSVVGDGETLIYKGEKDNVRIYKSDEPEDVGDILLVKVPEEPENTLPEARIIQPTGGPFFVGDEITFEGSGTDAEGGDLSEDHFQWESDLDGSIIFDSTSPSTTNALSFGNHTITLTVTDNEGYESTATTRITLLSKKTNSLGMEFHLLPAGKFMMGSPDDEPGRYTDETQHTVTLTQPFYMQTKEVTQRQWAAVMETYPSYFVNCGDDCPVERVSWYDCVIFCNTLSDMEDLDSVYYADSNYTIAFMEPPQGNAVPDVFVKQSANGYRLPTEAQWEYAARAGAATAFANGDITFYERMDICNYDMNLYVMGWYCYNSENGPKVVGQKNKNAWGLFDMHGNVAEWCQDRYGAAYPEIDVEDPTGPSFGSYRVRRGGSWWSPAKYERSSTRLWDLPGFAGYVQGCRLVLPQVQKSVSTD